MTAKPIKTEKKVFMANQTIFKQGEEGKEMYIVERGKVKITIQTPDEKTILLGKFGPSNFFGEMVLFGQPIRTATAVAQEHTSVIVIDHERMEKQLESLPPWFVTMFRTLIERLRVTNRKLGIEIKTPLKKGNKEGAEEGSGKADEKEADPEKK